jgi:hypothetical protein
MAAAAKTGFDVSKTFPVGHLRERHTQELVACGESATAPRHGVSRNASFEMLPMKHVCDLRKNESSRVHALLRLTRIRDGYPYQMRHTSSSTKLYDRKQLTNN